MDEGRLAKQTGQNDVRAPGAAEPAPPFWSADESLVNVGLLGPVAFLRGPVILRPALILPSWRAWSRRQAPPMSLPRF